MNVVSFRDESKFEGSAEGYFVPEGIEEIQELIRACKESGQSLTVQGSLTGITGAGVPVQGYAISMKKFNHMSVILDEETAYVKAEAGVTAEQLQRTIRQQTKDKFFFPVLPTEKTATLGGIVACGSRGIYSYHYGEFKDYVDEIIILNDQNEIVKISKDCLEFEELFHSEGTKAVILELRIRLIKKPKQVWGILFQFPDTESAVCFTEQILGIENLLALEYMDRNTIDLIESYKREIDSIADFPDVEDATKAVIYLELSGSEEKELMNSAEYLLEKCMEAGGDPDQAWAMCTEEEAERLRAFRHAASECVNMEIGKVNAVDRRIYKLSLDVCQELKDRKHLIETWHRLLEEAGLRYCIFGHFGKYGPYVNILACNYEQYKKGVEVFEIWIKDAYEQGMDVFAEHGIGKIKRELFLDYAPTEMVMQVIRQKKKWDRQGIFNPGTIV